MSTLKKIETLYKQKLLSKEQYEEIINSMNASAKNIKDAKPKAIKKPKLQPLKEGYVRNPKTKRQINW